MPTRKLYQELAALVGARQNCLKSNNKEWFQNHTIKAEQLVKQHMPSGSGIDCGTKLDWDASTGEKLVFHFDYHHMNENGYYDGWTNHSLTVKPSLQFGITLTISGRDRNQIKEYLYETFEYSLTREIEIS